MCALVAHWLACWFVLSAVRVQLLAKAKQTFLTEYYSVYISWIFCRIGILFMWINAVQTPMDLSNKSGLLNISLIFLFQLIWRFPT